MTFRRWTTWLVRQGTLTRCRSVPWVGSILWDVLTRNPRAQSPAILSGNHPDRSRHFPGAYCSSHPESIHGRTRRRSPLRHRANQVVTGTRCRHRLLNRGASPSGRCENCAVESSSAQATAALHCMGKENRRLCGAGLGGTSLTTTSSPTGSAEPRRQSQSASRIQAASSMATQISTSGRR
jgi:hypothetical protein